MINTKRCFVCGNMDLINPIEARLGDTSNKCYICHDCYNLRPYSVRPCVICGEIVFASRCCYECSKTHNPCVFCGEIFHKDELQMHNGRYYCENCYEELDECSYCGALDQLDNYGRCNDCQYTTFVCDGCGRVFDRDYGNYDDYNDEYYCDNCYDYQRPIKSYNYDPPEFLFNRRVGENTNRFFGIELEIGDGGECQYNAKRLLDITDDIYIKQDGSVYDGFELVSHPCSFNYHIHNLPWRDLIDTADNMGYKSHDASSSCGLHIHVSKDSFGLNPDEQDLNIMKILYLFEVLWNDILKFSRRNSEQVMEWANRYLEYDSDAETLKSKGCNSQEAEWLLDMAKKSGRYFAVNLENYYTIEFRIFRGTLKYNSFIATIQFIHNLCNLVCNTSVDKIQFIEFSDIVYYEEFEELNQYIKERGF